MDTFNLIIHMVSSLDGIIAKPDNSVAWFETADYYEQGHAPSAREISDFLKTIDCYVMGARTYEHALALSQSYGWPYGDIPTFVLTHQHLTSDKPHIRFYSGDLQTLVNEQLRPEYKNVWMAGGATLAADFIRLKLASEIRLSIMPIILGEGQLFLNHIGQEHLLHLKNVTAYKSGMVELHYEIRDNEFWQQHNQPPEE